MVKCELDSIDLIIVDHLLSITYKKLLKYALKLKQFFCIVYWYYKIPFHVLQYLMILSQREVRSERVSTRR